ncbi:Peptidoglycan/LPS O-acetylase OafA/YrhL, contains acyltransferase and SGNH-hydrolase domains [Alteromonadaceae bacterium Bs31]|nr:Peptidoglycan/LPS O-acetylase OafA/YrhL, contains acyltransferase and SGNH-hydrolase domains [Alteromonadaceae bacterium Bs31]
MDSNATESPACKPVTANAASETHLPALTGIRFFAVFHIFMFHLWVLYNMDKEETFATLMEGFRFLPEPVLTLFSNGWMSTSFFFILSGFILSYLYWGEDGELHGSKMRFWRKRLARIYPIHLIVMLLTFPMLYGYFSEFRSPLELLSSGLATVFLVQAWYPPWVPDWNWPVWTISALVFLYLIMPWLMRNLAKLSKQQMLILMLALPFISLIPTAVYAIYFPAGSTPEQNWQIFIGSTPLFWVPQFAAGMLLARYLGISRFNPGWRPHYRKTLARGDLAFAAVLIIAVLPGIEEPLKYFLRHGLMMPLYMLIIIDLARGHGIVAKIFSLPGTGFLGETAFSMFIWQNMVMVFCWMSVNIAAGTGVHQVWAAPLGLCLLAMASTYLIEKPLARKLR